MPVEPQKPYLSSKSASKKFGMTNDHIGLLCRRGKVAGLLWGRVWYVHEHSLLAYIKENSQRKEVRRQELSKQWRAAWMAVLLSVLFLGFSQRAAADYVTVRTEPLLQEAPLPVGDISVQHIARKLEQIMPPAAAAPTMPAAVVDAVPSNTRADSQNTLALLYQGVVALGEMTAAVIEAEPAHPAQLVLVDQTLRTPQETSLGRLVRANAFVADMNEALYGIYWAALAKVVTAAQFDAAQFAYVWDKTFGAFGERYVADLRSLNDMQVAFYFAAAKKLEVAYNVVADMSDTVPRAKSSISVASVGEVPLSAPLEALLVSASEQVDTVSSQLAQIIFGDSPSTPGCAK